jgi:hypothetical protein
LGAGVDKLAYESGNAGGQPPLPGDIPQVQDEISFGSYLAVAESDDMRYATTSSGNKYRSQRFVFTLTEDPASISSLYVEWEGYSEAADSILYIWNDVAGGWEEIGRHSSVAGDGVISATCTSGITDYIDANGELHIVATGSKAKGMTLYTDYLEVVVTAPCAPPAPTPTPTATVPPCYYNYDFASGAGVDKLAYESGNAGGQPPLPGNVTQIQNEMSFGSYTAVAASDDIRYATTSNGNKYRSHRFVFTIDEDPASISSLSVEWEGYAESVSSVLHIWNNVAGGWEEIGRHASVDGDAIIGATCISGIGDYISAGGELHLVAVGPKSNRQALYTDYVRVIVATPCP